MRPAVLLKMEPILTQSAGLSNRLTQLNVDGRRLIDDSFVSEKVLTETMNEIIPYATELFRTMGGTITHIPKISLYDCQVYFHEEVGGPLPNPENKRVFMKPDGGILMLGLHGKNIPILVVEDKVQGKNDQLHEQNKKRQATGNAIERGAKNIRGAEMLFSGLDIFPYVLFAAGCDFHETETIAKRIEMMNMGMPNHYIGVSPTTTPTILETQITQLLTQITVKKMCGKSIASVFVKAHKWDEMKHGASQWTKDERTKICKKVLDLVYAELVKSTRFSEILNT
jgi:hypothetical protein